MGLFQVAVINKIFAVIKEILSSDEMRYLSFILFIRGLYAHYFQYGYNTYICIYYCTIWPHRINQLLNSKLQNQYSTHAGSG